MNEANEAHNSDDVEGSHEEGENPSSVRHGRCLRCCHRWPRTALFLLGVVIPLWFIMIESLLWGYLLALLEKPEEVKCNNEALVAQRQAEVLQEIAVTVTNAIPSICFDLFFEKNETALLPLLEDRISTIRFPLEDPMFDGLVNTTEMLVFLWNCTATAQPIATKLLNEAIDAAQAAADQSLTFNWIRCSSLHGFSLNRNISSLRLPAQTEFYTNTWETNRAQLQEKYLEENLENATSTPAEALADASRRSLQDATGYSDDCRPNSIASAWFFFTVMTTVGYGNQSPSTTGGRAMVYTIGFVSILIFGVFLIVSGSVVSAILDDALRRRCNDLPKPVSAITWGSISTLWMLILAAHTDHWKHERLGEEESAFDLRDGYWFSFITSTTVGLGDIFIEPEVILFRDLLCFTLIILLNFTIFSAFLSKLSDMWSPRRLTWIGSLKTSLLPDAEE